MMSTGVPGFHNLGLDWCRYHKKVSSLISRVATHLHYTHNLNQESIQQLLEGCQFPTWNPKVKNCTHTRFQTWPIQFDKKVKVQFNIHIASNVYLYIFPLALWPIEIAGLMSTCPYDHPASSGMMFPNSFQTMIRRYKTAATQISHDAGLGAIPYTGRQFFPHRGSNQCAIPQYEFQAA